MVGTSTQPPRPSSVTVRTLSPSPPALTWVLGHWLLFYGNGLVAQPTLLLVAIGYGFCALYYLDHHDRLSKMVGVEIMAITAVIVLAIMASLLVNVSGTVKDLLR